MRPIIAVAPMMDCTDRHDRYFLRLISPSVRLYTEMITSQALIHGDWQRLLKFSPAERYIALQLGGNDPKALAHCARLGEDVGYDEINLNVGCPSPRVKSGRFGACLMLEPNLIADCIASMQASVKVPVTVKCRIGVDHQDSYEHLHQFVALIRSAGCRTVIIHARKAWLTGLNPKQNREIPPLSYQTVYNIKRDFPDLTIIINGGIKTTDDIRSHLEMVDGIMIGREAYSNPYILHEIERCFFDSNYDKTRIEVVDNLIPYVETELRSGVRLTSITRHLFGLFLGQPGAAYWRRYLSENSYQQACSVEVLTDALIMVNVYQNSVSNSG